MINDTGAIYTKNEIEFSWSIKLGVVYDENHIGQRCDRS